VASSYSIGDARSNLPTIVDQAEAGGCVTLTRRGKPVAVVVSLRTFDRLRGRRTGFAQAYGRHLRRYPLDETGLGSDFATSARDKSVGRRVAL
jgi:prevent-host-death family protein